MNESMKSMPKINLIRPAEGNETNAAYRSGLTNHATPTVICCSRGGVPALEHSQIDGALKGAYTIVGEDIPFADTDLILIGTGSEVALCVEAASKITTESSLKVRVVSMPCQDIFVKQSIDYQRSILPGNIPTLSVEASAVHGWHRFSHAQIGMTRFGMSAPAKDLFKHFGFTTQNVIKKGTELVGFYKKVGNIPDLMSRPVFDNIEV